MSQLIEEQATSSASPSGIVTFLLTDVEGSTRLWEEHFESMSKALEQHDAIVSRTIEENRGRLLKGRSEGDSQFSVFGDPGDAFSAALHLQLAFAAQTWPTPAPIRVRMGIHTGEAGLSEGEYFGTAIARAARVRGIAHGGQIVVSKAAYDAVNGNLPERASLKDLGAHRLKDLSTPEQIYQLVFPELEPNFPPLNSLDSHPNNLPVRLTDFIGREPEIVELKKLLEVQRCVSLTGSVGVGKTRLALQLAAERLDHYPHGVWFVDLETVSDEAMVPKQIASSIGVRGSTRPVIPRTSERRKRQVERALINYLRPFRILLVLDHYDHVREISGEIVDLLLRTCPGLRIMSTGIENLDIPGETAWPVPPLSVPDPDLDCTPESLDRVDSARLFIDRAMLANPEFVMTSRDATPIARICRLLAGNPMHIKLAAQWVKVLTCEQIAERLEKDPARLLRPRRTG